MSIPSTKAGTAQEDDHGLEASLSYRERFRPS